MGTSSGATTFHGAMMLYAEAYQMYIEAHDNLHTNLPERFKMGKRDAVVACDRMARYAREVGDVLLCEEWLTQCEKLKKRKFVPLAVETARELKNIAQQG